MNHLKNLRLSHKLPLVIITLGLLTAISTGILSYIKASNSLRSEAEAKLNGVLAERIVSLNDWLDTIRRDLNTQSENPTVLQALAEFQTAWTELGSNQTAYLQRRYIDDNPNPTGQKEELNFAPDGSQYSEVHAKFHPYFRTFRQDRGYYDIFLFDVDGNLIYTVIKELDYATNLVTDEWASSDLGNAFRAAVASDQVTFFDFKPYGPSHGAPASFISKPLKNEFGQTIGVLVFQMPIDRLNSVMNRTAGLGETGETKIIGEDLLMRSSSRFFEESTILNLSVQTPQVHQALAGNTGILNGVNHAGTDVLSAYSSIDFLGTKWAVIAEQNIDEVQAPIFTLRNQMIFQILFSGLIIGVIGIAIGRSVSDPMRILSEAMGKIADGDLNLSVPFIDRHDEVGEMANSLNHFQGELRNTAKLQEEQNRLAKEREQGLRAQAEQAAAMAEQNSKMEAMDHFQCIVEYDLHGIVLVANENYCNLLSCSPEMVVGKNHEDVIRTDKATQASFADLWNNLRQGHHQVTKFDCRKPDGSLVCLSATYNPIFDENGEPFKVLQFVEDITEKEELAREALYKSSAFTDASAAMMVVDGDFNVLYANQSTIELLRSHQEKFRNVWPDFNADNMIGTCVDVFHKEPEQTRKIVSDPARLPFRTNILIEGVKISLNVSGIYDENGTYAGNVLEWADITESSLNADKMTALNENQGTIEFDKKGFVVSANQQFLEVTGYTLDEIVGKHHDMFVPPEDCGTEEHLNFLLRLRDGHYHASTYKRIAKDGSEMWLQGSCNPIRNDRGHVYRIMFTIHKDVTDAELERNEYAAKMEAISASQNVLEFNLAGDVSEINDIFLNTSGYSREDVIGEHHKIFLPPEHFGTPQYMKFLSALHNGETQSGKYQGHRKDGSVFWLQANYNPIRDLNGHIYKIVMFAEDVTASELNRQRQEEEAAAQTARQTDVVNSLADGLTRLSNGDLTVHIDSAFFGEYDMLRNDFNGAVGKLLHAVRDVVLTAEEIHTKATDISGATDALSVRTDTQATTLEKTASTIVSVSENVKAAAKNSQGANDMAIQCREKAEASSNVVSDTVHAMHEIEQSSTQISQIIGVIDEISFQTNLLALNAGVEAARAGDAGRGFAVVAQEVRALAQRSTDAAREIKELIQTSSSHVDNGVALVGHTGEVLNEIVESVISVSELVSQINSAAQEQATSLEQVAQAVEHLDSATQQNASMVQETTTASHELNERANRLQKLTRQFKTGSDTNIGQAAEKHRSGAAA